MVAIMFKHRALSSFDRLKTRLKENLMLSLSKHETAEAGGLAT